MNMIHCPRCTGLVANDGRFTGLVVTCPHCRQPFQIPGSPPPQQPPSFTLDAPDEQPLVTVARGKRSRSVLLPVSLTMVGLACLAVIAIAVAQLSNNGQAKAPNEAIASKSNQSKEVAPPIQKPVEEKEKAPSKQLQKPDDNPKKYTAPLIVENGDDLLTVLAKARSNEFYRHDLNQGGIRCTFSASNARLTSQNSVAIFVEYKLAIGESRYDFDSKVYHIKVCDRLHLKHQYGVKHHLFPGHYIILPIPVEPDQAKEWRAMLEKKTLTLDVTFRIKKFSVVTETGLLSATDPFDLHVVDATVLEARAK